MRYGSDDDVPPGGAAPPGGGEEPGPQGRGAERWGNGADRGQADWLSQFARTFTAGAGADPGEATLLIAVPRGLLLDQLSTGDTPRTTRALEHFVQILDNAQGRPGKLGLRQPG